MSWVKTYKTTDREYVVKYTHIPKHDYDFNNIDRLDNVYFLIMPIF